MATFSPIAPDLVEAARSGDAAALENLAEDIYQRAYNLAVRFLWNTEDAEDAAQDVVVETLAALPRFRGEAAFGTYAYTIATRRLRSRTASPMERAGLSFAAYREDTQPQSDSSTFLGKISAADRPLMELELKRSCTYGMLLCLDREDRLAYILHCFFNLGGAEAASILGITHGAYRKRLSRVKGRMADFMTEVCGLAGSAPCRCADRLEYAAALGRIDPRAPNFARRTGLAVPCPREVEAALASMEELDAATAVFRADGALSPRSDRLEEALALIRELRPAVLRAPASGRASGPSQRRSTRRALPTSRA